MNSTMEISEILDRGQGPIYGIASPALHWNWRPPSSCPKSGGHTKTAFSHLR